MSVLYRLEQLFRETLDLDELSLSEDQTLLSIPEVDSMSLVQLILAVESDFHLKFEMKDIVELKTVGNLVAMVEMKGDK